VPLPDFKAWAALLAALPLAASLHAESAAPTNVGATNFNMAALVATNAGVSNAVTALQVLKEGFKSKARGEKMDLQIPVGEPITGIKIPQYDEEGKLSMTLLAGTARKIDDEKVELNNLKVKFSDKEEKEIVVEIPHALLDTETKMLVSISKTMISREDFDIEGEQAEFDTVSRTGTFKGRVRASFRNGAPSELP
jgi:hypothetical protein